jgi:hypothetical protein
VCAHACTHVSGVLWLLCRHVCTLCTHVMVCLCVCGKVASTRTWRGVVLACMALRVVSVCGYHPMHAHAFRLVCAPTTCRKLKPTPPPPPPPPPLQPPTSPHMLCTRAPTPGGAGMGACTHHHTLAPPSGYVCGLLAHIYVCAAPFHPSTQPNPTTPHGAVGGPHPLTHTCVHACMLPTQPPHPNTQRRL